MSSASVSRLVVGGRLDGTRVRVREDMLVYRETASNPGDLVVPPDRKEVPLSDHVYTTEEYRLRRYVRGDGTGFGVFVHSSLKGAEADVIICGHLGDGSAGLTHKDD